MFMIFFVFRVHSFISLRVVKYFLQILVEICAPVGELGLHCEFG